MADEQVVDEGSAETASATATQEPKQTAPEIEEVRRLAGEAKERERNAQEALRAANERNLEARREREAAARLAAETKAAAEEAQRIAGEMERGVQVLADSDPESQFGRMVRSARSAGGNGRPQPAPLDPEFRKNFDTLVQQVGETQKALSAVQLREATAAVDQVATGLYKGSLAPMLDGLVTADKFVSKVRKAVLEDPVIQRGCDEQTAIARIGELGREIANEIEGYGKAFNERWKSGKRKALEEQPPTGRDSAPTTGTEEKRRVKFNPNDPTGWEKYLKSKGAAP